MAGDDNAASFYWKQESLLLKTVKCSKKIISKKQSEEDIKLTKLLNDFIDAASFDAIMDIHIRTAPSVDTFSVINDTKRTISEKKEFYKDRLFLNLSEEIEKLKEMNEKLSSKIDTLLEELNKNDMEVL